MPSLTSIRAQRKRCSIFALTLRLAVVLIFGSTCAHASDTEEVVGKAVNKLLGEDWLPVVPPQASFALGVPATVRARNVVLICDSEPKLSPSPGKPTHDVRLDFVLTGGLRLDLLLGRNIAQWLFQAGLVSDVGNVSKISVVIEQVENRQLSLVQARKAELNWSGDCNAGIKDAWGTVGRQPFIVLGVSYWTNTVITAYDKSGAEIAISGKAQAVDASGKVKASLSVEDRYHVKLPGRQVVAIRGWPLRKRPTQQGGEDTSRVEVSDEPFTLEAMSSLYEQLDPVLK